MKHFSFAYTLPSFEDCTRKQKFHRHDIHHGVIRGENVATVERQLIERHPSRKLLVRYINEISRPEDVTEFQPAFLDINSHLWWEIGSTLVA